MCSTVDHKWTDIVDLRSSSEQTRVYYSADMQLAYDGKLLSVGALPRLLLDNWVTPSLCVRPQYVPFLSFIFYFFTSIVFLHVTSRALQLWTFK